MNHPPRSGRQRGRDGWVLKSASIACLLFTLWGCASVPESASQDVPGLITTVIFAPEGRLWRVRADSDRIQVDYSDDSGQSFSTPVLVNEKSQRIKAFPEDRPAIAVDKSGRIAVIYYAEESRSVVPYYSFSLDRGEHFSPPRALSRPGSEVEYSMVKLAADSRGQFLLFWYQTHGHDPGASLYYTVSGTPQTLAAPDRNLSETMCECCRLALDFDGQGQPVLFARVIFPGSIRDHALITVDPKSSQRVTDDHWRIEACPKQGPALSIASDGRYHIAWFTLGEKRQGLYYAYSADQGRSFSPPLQFGNAVAEHADVLALGERVVLAWKEFDGQKTRLLTMQSGDGGQHWSAGSVMGESSTASDYPDLVTNGKRIFVSWNALDHGYTLLPIQ